MKRDGEKRKKLFIILISKIDSSNLINTLSLFLFISLSFFLLLYLLNSVLNYYFCIISLIIFLSIFIFFHTSYFFKIFLNF